MRLPLGWKPVDKWPYKRKPTFQRLGTIGLMWLYEQDGIWSLEAQGYQGAIVSSTELQDVLDYVAEWDDAKNIRIGTMDPEEFADDFYGRTVIAVNAMADGDSASLETSREMIGKMEALLHELRGRCRDKDTTETSASKAERKSVELKLCVHDFYTQILYGAPDHAQTAIDILEDYVKEMKRELVAVRKEQRRKAS